MVPISLTSTRNPSSRGEKKNTVNPVSCCCDTALFSSVVSDCLVRFSLFVKSHLILVISDLTRFIKFWLVSTFAFSLCMCPRISRWFLLVFCFLYLYLLLGGASLGILSGSSLISPFSSLFTPFLPSSPSSHLVSHCHFVLGLILPLALSELYPNFLPFGASLHTVRLVTPLSPLRTIFSSSASLSLSALRHLLPFSKGVCPKRLRPTWQHLMTQSGL